MALTKRVPAGVGVSYGHTYVTERETTLALVPLGYADGIPRAAGNRAPVLAGGRAADASPAGSAWTSSCSTSATTRSRAGDEVVLWGPGDDGEPTAQDWADAVDTIHYEIVTRVGGRFTRRYVGYGGGGLMAREPASPAPAARTPSASSARVVGLAAAGTAAGRRASRRIAPARVRRRPSSPPRPDLAEPARRRAARQTTRSAPTPGAPTAPRWCGPTTACCCTSRRSARPTRPLTVVFVHGYTLSMAVLDLPAPHPGRRAGHRQRAPARRPAGLLRPARARRAPAAGPPSTRRSTSWAATWPRSSSAGAARARSCWSATRWAA